MFGLRRKIKDTLYRMRLNGLLLWGQTVKAVKTGLKWLGVIAASTALGFFLGKNNDKLEGWKDNISEIFNRDNQKIALKKEIQPPTTFSPVSPLIKTETRTHVIPVTPIIPKDKAPLALSKPKDLKPGFTEDEVNKLENQQRLSNTFDKEQIKQAPHPMSPAVKAFLKKKGFKVPKEIDVILLRASNGHPDIYNATVLFAAAESSLGKNLKGKGSTARGLFHLTKSTFLQLAYQYKNELPPEMVKEFHLDKIYKKGKGHRTPKSHRKKIYDARNNLYINTYLTSKYLLKNLELLKENFPKRDINGTDIYMSHYQGSTGGVKFIQLLEHKTYKTHAASGYPMFKNKVRIPGNYNVFFYKDGKGQTRERSIEQVYDYMAKNKVPKIPLKSLNSTKDIREADRDLRKASSLFTNKGFSITPVSYKPD